MLLYGSYETRLVTANCNSATLIKTQMIKIFVSQARFKKTVSPDDISTNYY